MAETHLRSRLGYTPLPPFVQLQKKKDIFVFFKIHFSFSEFGSCYLRLTHVGHTNGVSRGHPVNEALAAHSISNFDKAGALNGFSCFYTSEICTESGGVAI